MSNIIKSELKNGVRVLLEPVSYVRSAAIGLWCKTGSVDELPDEAGITHFIEHMLFKGTTTRTAKDIAEAIEGRGGVLNAFTDKEQTCYYARVLSDDVSVGIEVLTDMVLNSQLDPEELSKEKGVVLEEIKRSEDEPDDQVHEKHIQGIWTDHDLGKPVIGTKESVSSFLQANLQTYIARQYRGENVVLSIAGNIDVDQVLQNAEETLGQLPNGASKRSTKRPTFTPGELLIKKDVEQVHFCVGGQGCSIYDDQDVYTMALLDGVLGSGMSSRLFQEIREKRGLAYSVGSYALNYSDGGAFTIYGGTGLEYWEQVRELIDIELAKVRDEPIPIEELDRVKRHLSGHLVLALEGMNSRMTRMTRNELFHGREIPIEETLEKVNRVTPEAIRELANRVLAKDSLRTTAIGPF